MGNTRRMIRVMPAIVLALALAFQVVGVASAHAASRPRQVSPNTCIWVPDVTTSHNITLNGTVVGFYRAAVQHDSCNTGLHRGEAQITLTASNSGCNTGIFHFEFDVNGTAAELSDPDPSGNIGTLSSCTNGSTLEYDGTKEFQGSAAYCTKMSSVSWFQSWPNIQAGSC
jgi:hypothetical protein